MSSTKKTAPYGTWTSPITADIVSGSSLRFQEVHADTKSGSIYLVETRPVEKGRNAIVKINSGKAIDILPQEYNAGSKVHEYGGGAVALGSDGSLIFTDKKTSGVYKLSPDGDAQEIIKGDKNLRYANFDVHPINHNLILAVHEDHSGKEVINTIALIDASKKEAKVVMEGADFYSHPKFSPDGETISWLQWKHPDMPWTGSEVYIASFQGGTVGKSTYISGKPKEESIAQPKWHVDGTLLFCSDRTGFWQLYQYFPKSRETNQLVIKGFEETELGGVEFVIGSSTYISLNEKQLVITYTRKATNELILYDLTSGETKELATELVEIGSGGLTALQKVSSTEIAVIGTTQKSLTSLYLIDINKPSAKKLLKSSSEVALSESIFSKAESIEYPRVHGTDLGSTSYAMFVPPYNPSFTAPEGSKPPLIIAIHGGPTFHVSPGLSLSAQYFTSRGYAYCYVNYGGSTGYGRKYRELLDYNWGLKDCEDTVSCIDYLSKQGLIDGKKVGIRGGSAGGYTVLQGLVTFPHSFTAGCSHYGIGNLKMLAQDTHKFESHYLFALLFPESTPDDVKEKIIYDRSPVFHADKIESPLVLLQGEEDRVVPKEQAVEMEKILKDKGRDVKLVVFEGEGHGFVGMENIKRALEEEERLWKRTLLSA